MVPENGEEWDRLVVGMTLALEEWARGCQAALETFAATGDWYVRCNTERNKLGRPRFRVGDGMKCIFGFHDWRVVTYSDVVLECARCGLLRPRTKDLTKNGKRRGAATSPRSRAPDAMLALLPEIEHALEALQEYIAGDWAAESESAPMGKTGDADILALLEKVRSLW